MTFSNCDFSVTNVPTSQLTNMTGITGDGSNFSVSNSSFTGFETAIAANAGLSSPFKSFRVDNCTFTDNHTGVFSLGMQGSVITKNTFYIKAAANAFDYPTGLMMDNSSGYIVEKNHFYKATNAAQGRYGTMTEDSGPASNWIQGNFYKDLQQANFAQGINRGLKSGLQYWCNTDEGNVPTDFYVEGVGNGIHNNQGNGQATMNTFSHTGNDFQNNLSPILYYYKKNDAAHKPSDNSIGISKIDVTSLNNCPSDGGGICCIGLLKLTPTEWAQTESDYNTAKTGWDTKKAEILTLMDGGNTASLVSQINGATAQNAAQVKQQLLNISPYLSTKALSAAIAKKQVLTENAVIQVLNANPDGLRETEIYNLVKTSFTTTVANGILANAANLTARTTLDNEAGTYRATMHRMADRLLIDIANDSLQTDLTLLRTWLAKKDSPEASYSIVGTYLSVGDFTTAQQKLDEIPANFSLDAQGMTEHGYFLDLVNLYKGIYNSGTPVQALDATTVAKFKTIADNSKRDAGALAQGLLNTWYGYHYRVIPQLPNDGLPIIQLPLTNNTATTVANYLTAYPNPAKNNVTFKWDLPTGMESATITLSDLQGRTIEAFEVLGQQGKKEWSTDRLGDGVYLYRIKLPDGTSATSKLIIIK